MTLLHRGDKLLRGFDEDVRDALGEAYSQRGIRLALNRTVARLDTTVDGIAATLSDGSTPHVDQVLVATGRRPNTARLGLETAGIAVDGSAPFRSTAIRRPSRRRSTRSATSPTGSALTPVAIREGHAFADTVFGDRPDHGRPRPDPDGGVLDPGDRHHRLHGEATARARFGDIDVYKTSFRPMRATLSGRDDRVLMKLIVDARHRPVVGLHVVGHDAGEMIQLAGVAITMGATKADFDRTMAVHPTAAEELVTMRIPYVVKKPVAVG